jgi:hypothetical protein
LLIPSKRGVGLSSLAVRLPGDRQCQPRAVDATVAALIGGCFHGVAEAHVLPITLITYE